MAVEAEVEKVGPGRKGTMPRPFEIYSLNMRGRQGFFACHGLAEAYIAQVFEMRNDGATIQVREGRPRVTSLQPPRLNWLPIVSLCIV